MDQQQQQNLNHQSYPSHNNSHNRQKEIEEEIEKEEDTTSAIIVEIEKEIEIETETEKEIETEEEEEEEDTATAMIIAEVEKETMKAEIIETEEEMCCLQQQHTVRFTSVEDDPHQRSAMKSSSSTPEAKLRKSIAPPKCMSRRSSVDFNNNYIEQYDDDNADNDKIEDDVEEGLKMKNAKKEPRHFIKPVLKKSGQTSKSYSLGSSSGSSSSPLAATSRSLSPLHNKPTKPRGGGAVGVGVTFLGGITAVDNPNQRSAWKSTTNSFQPPPTVIRQITMEQSELSIIAKEAISGSGSGNLNPTTGKTSGSGTTGSPGTQLQQQQRKHRSLSPRPPSSKLVSSLRSPSASSSFCSKPILSSILHKKEGKGKCISKNSNNSRSNSRNGSDLSSGTGGSVHFGGTERNDPNKDRSAWETREVRNSLRSTISRSTMVAPKRQLTLDTDDLQDSCNSVIADAELAALELELEDLLIQQQDLKQDSNNNSNDSSSSQLQSQLQNHAAAIVIGSSLLSNDSSTSNSNSSFNSSSSSSSNGNNNNNSTIKRGVSFKQSNDDMVRAAFESKEARYSLRSMKSPPQPIRRLTIDYEELQTLILLQDADNQEQDNQDEQQNEQNDDKQQNEQGPQNEDDEQHEHEQHEHEQYDEQQNNNNSTGNKTDDCHSSSLNNKKSKISKTKSKSILRKNSNMYSSAPDRFDDAMEQQATAAILQIPTTTTTAITTVLPPFLPQPLVKPLRQKSNDNKIDANDIEDNDGNDDNNDNDDNDSGSIDLEEIFEYDNFEQEEVEEEVEVEIEAKEIKTKKRCCLLEDYSDNVDDEEFVKQSAHMNIIPVRSSASASASAESSDDDGDDDRDVVVIGGGGSGKEGTTRCVGNNANANANTTTNTNNDDDEDDNIIGIDIENDTDTSDDNDNVLISKCIVRANRRRSQEETYTKPLLGCSDHNNEHDEHEHDDPDNDDLIQNYIDAFNLNDRRDDILIELMKYPNSVSVWHKQLVIGNGVDGNENGNTVDGKDDYVKVKITQKEFWLRYFYKCSEKYILMDLRRRSKLGLLGQSTRNLIMNSNSSSNSDSNSNNNSRGNKNSNTATKATNSGSSSSRSSNRIIHNNHGYARHPKTAAATTTESKSRISAKRSES